MHVGKDTFSTFFNGFFLSHIYKIIRSSFLYIKNGSLYREKKRAKGFERHFFVNIKDLGKFYFLFIYKRERRNNLLLKNILEKTFSKMGVISKIIDWLGQSLSLYKSFFGPCYAFNEKAL
jgi:hypothetical protein